MKMNVFFIPVFVLLFIGGCNTENNKLDINKIKVNYSSYNLDSNLMLFGEGWYEEESMGRWTKDTLSKAIFFSNIDNVNRVKINGTYASFRDKPSTIFINDKKIGRLDYDKDKNNTSWSFNVPVNLIKSDQVNHIIIKSIGPIFSPKSLGKGKDERKIKFQLNRIILEQ